MRTYLYTLFLALCAFCLYGCSDSSPRPVEIARVDLALASFAEDSPAKRIAVIDSFGAEIDAMMTVLGNPYPTDEDLIEWSKSKVVEVFQPAVDSVFSGGLTKLERAVGAIVENARRDSLELGPLSFASVVWGSPRPIVKVDSIVLIALNHYLGEDYPGYAQWAPYRRAVKTPQMAPYDIAAVLAATAYPMQTADASPSLLSWMLYEGALVEARMCLVPGARLDMALGYTPDELELVKRQLPRIWEEMQLRKLVYDTDPVIVDRYIAPAPSTPLLDSTVPGRIGRYVGYCIVREYIKNNPGKQLSWLLSPGFYANDSESLLKSGFSGK